MTAVARSLLLLALAATGAAQAQTAPLWRLGEASTLKFVAVQQGAKFEGGFEEFSAEIRFSPDQLESSHLLVTVDTASVNTGYDDRDEVLRSVDFFGVMRWPEARFEASALRSLGGDRYEASGELTLRDETHPLTVPFSFTSNGTSAELSGEVMIARLRWGIGQGEWADTSAIGADVRVRFNMNLHR